ncbi:hypothetical protein [Streptomyces sp. CS090A]|uniref:hypothetical protein n=1 Tax=Streptomyces sp. CS090A TaxID=2162710 RepID=UPI0013A5A707|nr:hypothetical protein [Streptomyces sp. CS090A]
MDVSTEQAGQVLEKVGVFLRSLSPGQVDDLLAGRCRIALVKRQEPRDSKSSTSISSADLDRLREDLINASSREVGEDYIENQKLSRADLQALARALDIPVRKGDNMNAIKEGIVEATIGYRLRSGAIRGDVPAEGGPG